MKVPKLHAALQARGMTHNWLNVTIVGWLKKVVVEGAKILHDCPVLEIENSAGGVFHPGAY